MKALGKSIGLAGLLLGLAAGAASAAETVLDRQGGWEVVQSDGEGAAELFLAKVSDGSRTRLATAEVPTATVTNSYWDEYAGWDESAGRPVGGMVTRVDTVAAEYRFQAFVNDGAVYWEDRADGVARLWTAPCQSPEAKTLLAAGDAGYPAGTGAFGAEPWNRGAAWREAGADSETLAVFEDGAITRFPCNEAVAARKYTGRKGAEQYETDYGDWTSWGWEPPDFSWQSEFHDRQTVVIPDGVTRIGMGVFAFCTNLTSVTIPDSVTSIGYGAFEDCSGLTSVTIGAGVTSIGDWAFYGCSGLTSVTIPDSVTSIGSYAFYGCRGLTSVTIGDSVTSIGDEAFEYCSGLTSVTIPDGVTSIGSGTFEECDGLKTLSVPGAWEGTGMLDDVWGWSGKPEGCEVVYRTGGGDLLPEAGSEAEVAAALAGAADGRLGERIRSVGEYAAFRAWAAAKGLDAAAVLGSAHAWISYALGAEKLLGNEPEIVLGGVESVRAEGSKGAGGASMVVEVTVRDGGKAVAVDAEKVAGLFECTGDLRDWPGAAMGVSAARTGVEGASMRFEVAPAAGGAGRAFLRIAAE